MADNLVDPAAGSYSLNSRIILAGEFEQPVGYRIRRPQGTRDWLLTFTYGGAGSFGFDDDRHQCAAGDVVLIRPGDRHDYETREGEVWKFVWAHFLPEPGWIDLLQFP
ncbi:AraC family ligand binding domain-containing protein, partial [Paenibacillus sepulcri]|nr:AraC family ligand binding domain-containing protein [Paenibacillus sepulcri]